MPSAAALRIQIESALAHKIPSALTPAARTIYPVTPTGIPSVDALLGGGIPIGAITEIAGPECSGRTSLAHSTLAEITREGKVAAWIDVSDALHPESAAAAGVDLNRLLWVRCGAASVRTHRMVQNRFALSKSYYTAPPAKKGLHGGGFGPHPRTEEKGLSTAVSGLLSQAGPGPAALTPRCAEPQLRQPREQHDIQPFSFSPEQTRSVSGLGPLARIDQALRVTDLLLQAGGFGAIVIDLAGVAPEHVTRIPASTWFRYRAAAEKTRVAILLLTQHPCAQSSAALVLRLKPADSSSDPPGEPISDEDTVFLGMQITLEVVRQRFAPQADTVTPLRKPPQSERSAAWSARATWAAPR